MSRAGGETHGFSRRSRARRGSSVPPRLSHGRVGAAAPRGKGSAPHRELRARDCRRSPGRAGSRRRPRDAVLPFRSGRRSGERCARVSAAGSGWMQLLRQPLSSARRALPGSVSVTRGQRGSSWSGFPPSETAAALLLSGFPLARYPGGIFKLRSPAHLTSLSPGDSGCRILEG